MQEIKSMRGFALQLTKLEELPDVERLCVLRWLEIKIQAMVKAITED